MGRRKTSRLEGATYCSGLSVRLPAALLTARESRAVTDIELAGLAPLTDARQLVDCRLGCRMAWSEIETNTVISDGVLASDDSRGAHSNIDLRARSIGVSNFSHSVIHGARSPVRQSQIASSPTSVSRKRFAVTAHLVRSLATSVDGSSFSATRLRVAVTAVRGVGLGVPTLGSEPGDWISPGDGRPRGPLPLRRPSSWPHADSARTATSADSCRRTTRIATSTGVVRHRTRSRPPGAPRARRFGDGYTTDRLAMSLAM